MRIDGCGRWRRHGGGAAPCGRRLFSGGSLNRVRRQRPPWRRVSISASIKSTAARRGLPGRLGAMKFTTLIPTTRNDGTAVKPAVLERLIDSLWRPFRGMTKEGNVTGRWIDD